MALIRCAGPTRTGRASRSRRPERLAQRALVAGMHHRTHFWNLLGEVDRMIISWIDLMTCAAALCVWVFSSGATLGSAPTPNLSTSKAIGFKHSCSCTELTSSFNSKLMSATACRMGPRSGEIRGFRARSLTWVKSTTATKEALGSGDPSSVVAGDRLACAQTLGSALRPRL